jgi:hypothetical protein
MTNARDKANIPVLNFQSKGIDDNADATAITINSSENVLINTTSASGFDAGGLPLLVGNGSTHQGLTIYTGTSHTGAIHFADGTGAGSYRGQINYRHDTDALQIAVAGSEKMRLNSTGLGIGTSSPSRKLHIVSSDNQLARFESTDTYGGIELCDNTSGTAKPLISAVANDFVFYRGGSSHTVAFGATSVGFGVGTASPSEELECSGAQNTIIKSKTTTSTALGGFEAWNNASGYMKIYSYGSSTSGTTFGGVANANVTLFEAQGASNVVFSTWSNAGGSNPDFIFAPQRSQKLIIKSDGKVGIGTSSPSEKLDVNGTVKATSFSGDGSALTGISSGAGSVVAYAMFNGANNSVQSTANVSSINDNGTGEYVINFTSSLSSANYTMAGAGRDPNTNTSIIGDVSYGRSDSIKETGRCEIATYSDAANLSDFPEVNATFFE